MSSLQAHNPDLDHSLLNLTTLLQELPFPHHTRATSRENLAVLQDIRPQSTDGGDEQQQDLTKHHDPSKPTYITTLPFELRGDIFTHLALASSFEFLRVCRSFNTQATPLLYKYGIYHIRAIHPRRQYLISVPPSSTIAKIQNLYISMPNIRFEEDTLPKHDVSAQKVRLLRQFSGLDVPRTFCHLDLQAWHLTERMESVLRTFVGFERIGITARLRSYEIDHDENIRPHDLDIEEEEREYYIKAMNERLGPWLGEADCTSRGDGNTVEGSGNVFESMLFFDFYPGAVVS